MIEKLDDSDWSFLNTMFAQADLTPSSRYSWLEEVKIKPLPAGWGFVQNNELTHREFVSQFHGKLKIQKREEQLKLHLEKLLAECDPSKLERSSLARISRLLDEDYVSTATTQIELRSTLRIKAASSPSPDPDNVFSFSPLLKSFSENKSLVEAQPFAGKRVILVLHFLRDLMPFIVAAEKLGLEPSRTVLFHKLDYGYPHRDFIHEWLISKGYKTILTDKELNSFSDDLVKNHPSNEPLLIVEDGGYFSPRIATCQTDVKKALVGIVEQTTNGIMRLKDALGENVNPPFPFLSLPACQIKSQIEPPFIGLATTHTLQTMLSGVALAGQTVGMIGFGTIGKEVARCLKDLGAARIKVYDKDEVKLAIARSVGCEHVNSPEDAAHGSFLLLGGSGRLTITDKVMDFLRDQAIIGSTSSRSVEIDMDWLNRNAKSKKPETRIGEALNIGTRYLMKDNREIIVLANGTPLNFWNTEGMPDQIGDFIMSLLLLAAAELATGGYASKKYDKTGIDGIAADYRVAKSYLEHWYR